MDVRHQKIILDNIEELVKVTHDLDKIVEYLQTMKVLNEYMVKHLMEKYHARKRRHREFFHLMLGRGPSAFDCLVAVLRGTENFRAEELLCDHKVLKFEIPSPDPEPELPRVDELDLGSPKSESDVQFEVKKHPEDKFMDCPIEGEIRSRYKMRSNPRGHAIIINIFKTINFPDRLGSDVDRRKLEHLFKELGFVVFSRENLTADEIRREIKERSADPELEKVDCLVVFIMCHGRQKDKTERSAVDLMAANGESIDTNWITKEFQTPALRKKPKLFFFQACRSVMEDEKESGTFCRYGKSIETDSELISDKALRKEYEPERDYEDTCLGFATIPGKVSMRHPETGSWFVDAFCEIIADKAWKFDLDDLWSKIDEHIKMRKCTKGYQTPELVKRGFNKRLFFNPHLYG